MDVFDPITAIAALLAPPLCSACAGPCRPNQLLCEPCARQLSRTRPGQTSIPGVGTVVWAASYRAVARDLVAALKFEARTRLAKLIALRIASALGPMAAGISIVPVPAARRRERTRGFDPAGLIAVSLAGVLGVPLWPVLERADGPRQVGRRRSERLSDPPRVRCAGSPPAVALVVDDVLTTGATLAACGRALRAGGSGVVRGAVFARALGERVREA